MKHFIKIEQLSLNMVEEIFSEAKEYLDNPQKDSFAGKKLINLFFENSTRTRSSFEIASKNMGMEVVNIDISSSALKKGESERDTILTLNAMNPDFITIRHSYAGIVEKLAAYSKKASVINSGDGAHAHPTQALLDCFTIMQAKEMKSLAEFKDLTVAICGDIINSRVARSNIKLLTLLGAKINLVGPSTIIPRYLKQDNIKTFSDLAKGVKGVDVIMALRIQKERMYSCFIPSVKDYYKSYGITAEILKLANDPIVLHPGPINRGVEISSEIADNEEICLVLKQVEHGIAIRQAILAFMS